MIQDPLAMMLLEGKFSDSDTVEVDVRNGELTFNKAKVATAVG
jgi:ATP-dependent Clp protease ATP-binding subunit ClpA